MHHFVHQPYPMKIQYQTLGIKRKKHWTTLEPSLFTGNCSLFETKQTIIMPWLWEGKEWHHLTALYSVCSKLAGSSFDRHPELLISDMEPYGNASCNIECKAWKKIIKCHFKLERCVVIETCATFAHIYHWIVSTWLRKLIFNTRLLESDLLRPKDRVGLPKILAELQKMQRNKYIKLNVWLLHVSFFRTYQCVSAVVLKRSPRKPSHKYCWWIRNPANHLGCAKPGKSWHKLPTSTGDRRISEPSTVSVLPNWKHQSCPLILAATYAQSCIVGDPWSDQSTCKSKYKEAWQGKHGHRDHTKEVAVKILSNILSRMHEFHQNKI